MLRIQQLISGGLRANSKLRGHYTGRSLVSRWCSSQPTHGRGTRAVDIGTCIELDHPQWPHSLRVSYLWLRDHCRCDFCYNHGTAQRSFDITHMPLNIKPVSVVNTPDGIELMWPDGHISDYKYKFVWQNIRESCRTSHKTKYIPWIGATFPKQHMINVTLEDLYKEDKSGLRKLFNAILQYGLAFITNVPPDTESTRSAIEKVCAIKKTLYGEMWELKSLNYEHKDTAYSQEFIGAHTDHTYFTHAARIQVFHCLQQAREGGETLLVDGFSSAQQFKEKDPDGYKFLSTMAIPSEFKDDNQHFYSLDTIIKHNPVTGNIKQIRYNIYDRAPMSSISLAKIEEFYQHFCTLSKIIKHPRNEYWQLLEPGTVLFVDNWRVFHGRNAFNGGTRIIAGCYLDNEEFTSAARMLGVHFE